MIICKEFLCSIPIAMTGMRKTDSGLEMTGFPRKIWRDRSGATAIEYAFIAAGIALAIVSVVTSRASVVAVSLYEDLGPRLSTSCPR